jgi:hypothetical protein
MALSPLFFYFGLFSPSDIRFKYTETSNCEMHAFQTPGFMLINIHLNKMQNNKPNQANRRINSDFDVIYPPEQS